MTNRTASRATHQTVGLIVGPAVAATLLLLPPPDSLSIAAWRTAALGLWMGIWWATEAIPVAATALLPLATFPLLKIGEIKAVAAPYAHPTIFLFLGGFVVALAIQRWGLHTRLALAVISVFGGSGASLVAGFMIAGAAVSMWVTNTSTTMMLLPIALSVVAVVQANVPDSPDVRDNFPVAMLLGVAYSATIGGLATLIGTPPNALLSAYMEDTHHTTIGFVNWMQVGIPLTLVLLPICWWLLTRRLYPLRFTTGGPTRDHLRRMRRDLGPLSGPEKRVATVFALLVLGWLTRPLLNRIGALSDLSDTGVAMLAALILFAIPSGGPGSARLMRWKDARGLPWGLLLLFGGGLSLAASVSASGLAQWLGQSLNSFDFAHPLLLVIAIATLVIFLTELTSNMATAATFLPVAGAIALESGVDAIQLAAPVALAASCAFMLPVATPPNAIVFGSGKVTIPQMMRAGLWLNLIAIVLVSLVSVFLAPALLGHG